MFLTSSTTALAFIATSFTPIMPFVSFGIFAALVVLVNLAMALLILPTTYLVYHKHVLKQATKQHQDDSSFHQAINE